MRVVKRRGSDRPTGAVQVIPGLERLKARLHPGQYLRARVLRYLDERRLLLRLLGRTVVASSSRHLPPGKEIWVRVRSVDSKVHLQLAQAPPSPIEAGVDPGSAPTVETSREAYLALHNSNDRVKVSVARMAGGDGSRMWSIVLGLGEAASESLRFVLAEDSNLLSIRLVSEDRALVNAFMDRRDEVLRIAESLGFASTLVGARTARAQKALVSGEPAQEPGVDLVI